MEPESHIEENNVAFDYRFHEGHGGESNAPALLQAFGFPDEIIRDAQAAVKEQTAEGLRINVWPGGA